MSVKAGQSMYGLVAEFDDEEKLKHAAQEVRAAGYTQVRAFTPFRVDGLAETLGHRENVLPWLVILALIVGAGAGFWMQYYTDVISYPLNVGGRPLNSWPSFIIICFELAILFGALTTFGGMLAFNGLPLPYHPIFNTANFELASGKRFYLCIESSDKRFHLERTRRFLEGLAPKVVSETTG
jgi:hypothetical protein